MPESGRVQQLSWAACVISRPLPITWIREDAFPARDVIDKQLRSIAFQVTYNREICTIVLKPLGFEL